MLDYNFSNDFYKNIDAMIYTCGHENCKPGHSYGPILRNGYLIHYILSGTGIYKARGKIFRLKEGDAFLICPTTLFIMRRICILPGVTPGLACRVLK